MTPVLAGPRQITGASGEVRNEDTDRTRTPPGASMGINPSSLASARSPSIPVISGTSGPCMSASTIPTLWPAAARAYARLTATVVLPTPPFPLITSTLWGIRRIAARARSSGLANASGPFPSMPSAP